jgi:uncharacterized protein YjdB
VYPINATNKQITWMHSGVGSISAAGLFTSDATTGAAFIYAVSVENAKIRTNLYVINVVVPLESFTISATRTDIYRTFTKPTVSMLSIVPIPANATMKPVTFVSSNRNIAFVISRSGVVMSQPVLGTATITATITDPLTGVHKQTIQIRNLLQKNAI